MAGRSRANGEGSIYPYRNGFAAYAWVTTPSGTRKRKHVYGQTRDDVHDKWLKLHQAAKNGVPALVVPVHRREHLGIGWLDLVARLRWLS
jgi:hypothetical protein